MVTTALIVELLIIGFFSFIWIFLIIYGIWPLNYNVIINNISIFNELIIILILIGAVIFYSLGILMNILCFKIFEKCGSKIAKSYLGRINKDINDIEYIISKIYQKGSEELINEIIIFRSWIRIARSGIINLFLIALFTFILFNYKYALIPLIFSVISIPIWRHMTHKYWKRLVCSYKVINEK